MSTNWIESKTFTDRLTSMSPKSFFNTVQSLCIMDDVEYATKGNNSNVYSFLENVLDKYYTKDVMLSPEILYYRKNNWEYNQILPLQYILGDERYNKISQAFNEIINSVNDSEISKLLEKMTELNNLSAKQNAEILEEIISNPNLNDRKEIIKRNHLFEENHNRLLDNYDFLDEIDTFNKGTIKEYLEKNIYQNLSEKRTPYKAKTKVSEEQIVESISEKINKFSIDMLHSNPNFRNEEYPTSILKNENYNTAIEFITKDKVDIDKSLQLDEIKMKFPRYENHDAAIEFVAKNKVNVDKLLELEESTIKFPNQENPILKRYGIVTSGIDAKVSIGEIVGYSEFHLNSGDNNNILFTMKNFFDRKSNGYKARSIGMLDFESGEDALKKLEKSFEEEPLSVEQLGENKFYISSNGLHRYTILRLHYLNDLIKENISLEELNKKYQIPVSLTKYQKFNSYCNYIINKCQAGELRQLYNEHGDLTGELKFCKDNTEEIIDKNRLKEITEKILNDNSSSEAMSKIKESYIEVSDFKNFIDTYFPDFIERIEE